MHELGILSKKEVREIVLKNRLKSAMSPTSEVPSAPSASPTVNVPSAPKKRKSQGEVPKSKRNPVETTTAYLRNIAGAVAQAQQLIRSSSATSAQAQQLSRSSSFAVAQARQLSRSGSSAAAQAQQLIHLLIKYIHTNLILIYLLI